MLKLFRFILFVYVGKVSPVKQMKKHGIYSCPHCAFGEKACHLANMHFLLLHQCPQK